MSVIIGVKVESNAKVLGKGGRKALRDSVRAALIAAALYWHSQVLDRHFLPSNRGRYAHQARTDIYRNFIKKGAGRGQGRYVDLLLEGKSRRYLKAFANATGTHTRVRLTMKGPAYFANPFIGTFTDTRPMGHQRRAVTKRITQQPDKVAELTRVDARDARDIRDVGTRRLALLLRAEEYVRNIRVSA